MCTSKPLFLIFFKKKLFFYSIKSVHFALKLFKSVCIQERPRSEPDEQTLVVYFHIFHLHMMMLVVYQLSLFEYRLYRWSDVLQ